MITGGYPCQPFSAAGNRLGREDHRHLWPFIDHHIATINPRRVFFENVEGHITLGLSTVISDLEERGYDTTWGIFSAREVGAPHQRKRVFIMADAIGKRLQRGSPTGDVSSKEPKPTDQQPTGRDTTPIGTWPPEPSVGRVVNGSSPGLDRVDRIRLLGNGVVPQTAAKAWLTLDAELNQPAKEPTCQ